MIAAAAVVSVGAVFAPVASAEDSVIHTLGGPAQLVNGDVVQAWTVTGLKPSADAIPYAVAGTLWEATASDVAVRGTVQPVVSNLNARARSGQTYRVLFGVATPQGVNPAALAQGQQTSGKVYFDVTGDVPDSVVYNAGGPDLAVWVQPPPAPPRTASSGSGSSASSATGGAAPTAAAEAAPAGATPVAAPASAGAPVPGSQGTPVSPGSAGTPAEPGSAGTPVAPGSQGTPVPGSTGTPVPGSTGTPVPSTGASTPSGTEVSPTPAPTAAAPAASSGTPAAGSAAPAGPAPVAPTTTVVAPPASR
ncbi:MPT63 family protein (plasmid) [Mycobacterium avium subsp. hominissuis]